MRAKQAKRRRTTQPARTQARPPRRPVREYSRAFTPSPGDPRKDPATWGAEYKMNRIPRGMWRSVKAKAKRDGVSLRHLLLTYLQAWVDGDKAAA